MDYPQDWDLLAIVRSCSSTITTTATTTTSQPQQQPPPPLPQEPLCFSPTPSSCSTSSILFGFSSPLPTTSFWDNTTSNNNNFQSISSSSCRNSPVSQFTFEASSSSPTVTSTFSRSVSQTQKIKKRKNLMKKVCHVPTEGLSSDMWAWRKYGQKPIKGSPYPRGYYKCSSSKGCLARKQVERNRTDPKMFIVTYTGDHNHPMPAHRNTLAGSTRNKPQTSSCTPSHQPTNSSSPSPVSLSPLTEKIESQSKTEECNDIGRISELMFDDDFYFGFDKIDGLSDDSDCFSEQFSSSSDFPWLASGAGATSATATGEV